MERERERERDREREIETDRQTDRQTETETERERQTDRQTDRDRQTERQRENRRSLAKIGILLILTGNFGTESVSQLLGRTSSSTSRPTSQSSYGAPAILPPCAQAQKKHLSE